MILSSLNNILGDTFQTHLVLNVVIQVLGLCFACLSSQRRFHLLLDLLSVLKFLVCPVFASFSSLDIQPVRDTHTSLFAQIDTIVFSVDFLATWAL